ncbi:outer membrane protein transport protein [Moraxella oblonga]|uniref:outer membrane protein transport protein n=1 Tax=Moraxella oblonga TaxID=200413 RepID=UPI00082A1AB6|nr:outer membrane protein transport protein [Moraxella oblonga]
MSVFNYKTLAVAVGSMGLASTAYSAGLDRSGQDVTAFLQDGTYAEAVYTYIDADVSGHDNGATGGASAEADYVKGKATGDISEDYDFFRFGVKADINDRFSVGVLYDEPFGASVDHFGNSNFVGNQNATTQFLVQPIANRVLNDPNINPQLAGQIGAIVSTITSPESAKNVGTQILNQATVLMSQAQGLSSSTNPAAQAQALADNATKMMNLGASLHGIAETAEKTDGQGTNVEIRTNNLTTLLGAKFGANKNFQVYGGPALQRLNGEVHLRGIAYQQATGYDAKISSDTTLGWVAGVAYSKPEIALKASLTYRSETEHDTTIAEVFPARALAGRRSIDTQPFSVTLPESYNLDFQTGINPTTLLTAKVRYVPWSDFKIEPTMYTATTSTPIISYTKDQWSGELGLAKKLSDKWAVSGTVGYDSGAGNPISTLGPIKGYHSVGLGAKYNITKEWSVSAGAKYLMFGDGTANLPNGQTAGKFADNDGIIAGLKVAYHGK